MTGMKKCLSIIFSCYQSLWYFHTFHETLASNDSVDHPQVFIFVDFVSEISVAVVVVGMEIVEEEIVEEGIVVVSQYIESMWHRLIKFVFILLVCHLHFLLLLHHTIWICLLVLIKIHSTWIDWVLSTHVQLQLNPSYGLVFRRWRW